VKGRRGADVRVTEDYTQDVPSQRSIRRAIVALPFIGALGFAAQMNRETGAADPDVAHPGFRLTDATAAAGIHFVHRRPTFDPRIANIGAHVAAVGAGVSVSDFDGDGWPDLYFTSSAFGAPNALYRNRGDGTFEDVSVKSGITKAFGAGLGVMAVDLNDDGWPDLYVANDGNPNQLWINQKDGTFRNEADIRGAAVNADGMAEAGMGIDIGDFDGNGSDDIFLTHLTREKSTLFVNRGEGYFEDRSVEVGVAAPSIPFTGFGTAFLDYDNDGWLDVVAANGAVHLIEELRAKGDPYPLHQRKQLFHNLGNGHFEEATAAGGAAFQLSEVGRGLAVGDLDNDGGVDFVVNNNNGTFRVFHNDVGAASNWLGLRLLSGKHDAYGARVEVHRAGLPVIWRRVRADGSYLSANDPRVVVGLGTHAKVDALIVHWPDRVAESFDVPPLAHYTTLVEGSGRKEAKR
jgi:enediyne biosynthesis protein E4